MMSKKPKSRTKPTLPPMGSSTKKKFPDDLSQIDALELSTGCIYRSPVLGSFENLRKKLNYQQSPLIVLK
jgi:hypothetical protein